MKDQNSSATSGGNSKTVNKDDTIKSQASLAQNNQEIAKGSKDTGSEQKMLNTTALTKSKSSRNISDALKAIDTDNAEEKSTLLKNEKVKAEVKEKSKLREDKVLSKMSKGKSDRCLDKNKSASCINVGKNDGIGTKNNKNGTRNSENELDEVGNIRENDTLGTAEKKERGNLKKSKSDDLIRGSATNLVKLFNEFKLLKKKKRKRWDVPSDTGGSANECTKMKRKHRRSVERDNEGNLNGNEVEINNGERDLLINERRKKTRDDFGETGDSRHRRSVLVTETLKEFDEMVNETKDEVDDSIEEKDEEENDQNVRNIIKRSPEKESKRKSAKDSSRRNSKKQDDGFEVVEEEDLNDEDCGFDSAFRAKVATLTKSG